MTALPPQQFPVPGEIWRDRMRSNPGQREVTVIGTANGEVQYTAPAAFAPTMLQRYSGAVEWFVQRYEPTTTWPKDAA